jgi:DNA-binding NarL/FixJ family response regulator
MIVDDENLVRAGLRAIINAEPDMEVVGAASDGAEAVPLVGRLRPDVVLMDVRMPTIDGIQATTQILERFPDPPRILVITTFENDDYVYDALRAGASGFLLKRARPEKIVHAVRLMVEGDSLLFPVAIRNLMAERADAGTPRAKPAFQLTTREAEVLRLMARGLTNAEIAEDLAVRLETVKTHVSNVLAKLKARDRTQAVVFAYESGFVETS